ncbi:MAG: hypothetical protein ACMUJM_23005 [bacterium]
MKLIIKIIFALIFCFTASTVFGNGALLIMTPTPVSDTSSFLQGLKFGMAGVSNGRAFLYDGGMGSDTHNTEHWINSPLFEKDMVGKKISLFSRYGFICNADCYQKEAEHDDDFSVTCESEEKCFIESQKLPKYSRIFFMYPALNKLSPPSIDKSYSKKEEELISSFTYNAISEYIKEHNIKDIYPKYHMFKNNIEKIGVKGPIFQYFVETKIGTVQSFEKGSHVLHHVFSFILEIKKDVCKMRQIIFMPGIGDGSGYIRLEAVGDINQDGLIDLFWIHNTITVFDGEKWIFLWRAGGC